MVEGTLRFLIEQVGQVEGVYADEKLSEDFLLRRGAGNGLEMLGILTLRVSPVWVLAALADISGTGRALIADIALELEKHGLLEPGQRFETMEQVLDGLERTAGRAAESVNTPPLNVQALRDEWTAITAEAAKIPAPRLPKPDDLWQVWGSLKAEAARQQTDVFQLSALMGLSALRSLPKQAKWLGMAAAHAARRSGQVLADQLLRHYRLTLKQIHEEGYSRYWQREFRPYLHAALGNFSPGKTTWTQRFLSGGRRP